MVRARARGAAALCLGLLAWLSPGAPARAHEPGLSALEVGIAEEAAELRVRVTLALLDARLLTGTDFSDPVPFERVRERVTSGLQLEVEGAAVAPLRSRAVRADSGDAVVEVHYPLRSASATLRVGFLAELPGTHRQFVALVAPDGRRLDSRLLDARDAGFALDLAALPAAPTPEADGLAAFFSLGALHILTGFDHLLFLFSLLVAGLTLGRACAVITAFTVAHSITLALAGLDLVRLPAALVEPLIAASILYVAVENLMGHGRARSRWALTFGFGLVHGLGFAGALGELGIGRIESPLLPLLAFNAGIEAAQLALAALVVPLLALLQRWPAFYPRFAFAASSGVLVLGSWWLLERTLLA